MNKNKIIVAIICVFLLNVSVSNIVCAKTQNFVESIEEFNNPDVGIYRPTVIKCKATGEWPNTKIQYPGGLVHLRIGLKSFTRRGNNDKDYDITDEHIQKLNEYLDQVRQAGGTAIVRFAYDDFEGTKNLEPDIEQILRHIEQLEPFFRQNEDIIACVETGLLGPWGEQHTSTIMTEENIKKVTDKMLEVVPESRSISVRRPKWYCATIGLDIRNIKQDVSVVGTGAYRIGLFNDGYLGSSTDLGTFREGRNDALTWLSNQATHTLYGGEVSLGTEVDENGYIYHSINHIKDEMFITHTSYLNEEWNNTVIKEWKNGLYQGDDALYNGKSAYLYIKNHLGYRLVLNETQIPQKVKQNNVLDMHINLKNVGAGNVVNEKTTYIVLKNDSKEYIIKTDIDVRNWLSKNTYDFDIELPLSQEVEVGNYEVYMKITNSKDDKTTNKRTIRFANENVWNSSIGANKIGSVEVEKGAIKGDVNEDNYINSTDAAIVLDLFKNGNATIKDYLLGDMNEDNQLNASDAAMILDIFKK